MDQNSLIRWNPDIADRLRAPQCGVPAIQNQDQVLAHELGHAYANAFEDKLESLLGSTDFTSITNQLALDFENVANGGPPRTQHDY